MPFGETVAAHNSDNTAGWDMSEVANEAAANARALDEESAVEASEMQDILDQRNREIGAKILTVTGFQNRHKESTHRSLDQYRAQRKEAKSRGEKLKPLAGKGEQRRNDAYVYRIEKFLDVTANETNKAQRQKRFFDLYSHETLVKPENIPEGYWKKQEQILRDEGYGDVYIDSQGRKARAKELIDQQKESIKPWANYLGHENCPYPTWFRIYAMDGVLNLGTFNKEEHKFSKRDKSTVAPYPHLNTAALAKVYGAISDFYNLEGQDFNTKTTERENESPEKSTKDKKVQSLIESGNFNTLYAHFLTKPKEIIPTPEKAEDVRGRWIEYLPGDEEELASAADGTPWCVASPNVGRNYLVSGEYGDGAVDENPNSKAKFILFHLQDENGNTSEQASASIRLDTDGKVAEISGLLDGQALAPALVPIVEEKVKTLPGGEKFLDAFADKKMLIALDHKMKANEGFTNDELAFIFELHRDIATLDTYNDKDPRIDSLREYSTPQLANNIGPLLKHGADADRILINIYLEDIVENLDTILKHDVGINQILDHISAQDKIEYLDTLLEHGANINYIVDKMPAIDVAQNLDALLEHGADIDINHLAGRMYPDSIIKYLDTLLEHGANIDIDHVVGQSNFLHSIENVDLLLRHDVEINYIVEHMVPSAIYQSLDDLLERGADINCIIDHMYPKDVIKNLNKLVECGIDVDINHVIDRMYPDNAAKDPEALRKLGASADIFKAVNRMHPEDVIKNLDALIELGASINIKHIIERMSTPAIIDHLDTILKHDIDIDYIIDEIDPDGAIKHIDTLLEHGAEIDSIINILQPKDVIKHLDTLVGHGADIEYIIEGIPRKDLIKNQDIFRKYGAGESLFN